MARKLLYISGFILLSWSLWLFKLANEIRDQSMLDEARPIDVILVLGAAEYRGRPSPVLKARLDHALTLYGKGYAGMVMTTGGAGGDPDFTEGGVARNYLVKKGVPIEQIILEAEGESTIHSVVAAAEIMKRMNLKTCIAVSDGYHLFRAKKMLEANGVVAFGSPRPGTAKGSWREWWLYLRQAVGYTFWLSGLTI
jgi:uncharacterized SAM-binding protein YcdF (DUF218 family)